MPKYRTRTCDCGSNLQRRATYDARGIFLTYVCDQCTETKLAKYHPDVLTDPNYWHTEPIDPE